MHPDEINGMPEALALVVKDPNKARRILERYWRDQVALVWTAKQVHRAAYEVNTVLTLKEARVLLRDLHQHYNPQYGIQWSDVRELIQDSGLGRDITRKELLAFIHHDVIAIARHP